MRDRGGGVSIERLSASSLDAFRSLHSGDDAWCQCVAWWVPGWDGWGARTAEENSALRQSLFDRGVHDGYLIRFDGALGGWCQAWQRSAFTKLSVQFGPSPDDKAWMIGCVLVKPPFRGKGLARQALRLVVDDLRARGASSVDAFPKRHAGDEGELWNGPESTYLGLGFRVVKDDPKRPLLRISFL